MKIEIEIDEDMATVVSQALYRHSAFIRNFNMDSGINQVKISELEEVVRKLNDLSNEIFRQLMENSK